jgi:hypothetical protein
MSIRQFDKPFGGRRGANGWNGGGRTGTSTKGVLVWFARTTKNGGKLETA